MTPEEDGAHVRTSRIPVPGEIEMSIPLPEPKSRSENSTAGEPGSKNLNWTHSCTVTSFVQSRTGLEVSVVLRTRYSPEVTSAALPCSANGPRTSEIGCGCAR